MSIQYTKDSQNRYDRFIELVGENNEVWGLQSEDGWAIVASNQYEDTGVMLFWPAKAYASQCAVEEWAHYHAAAIPLPEFLGRWIPGMDHDELLIGVNWNKDLVGVEVEPLDLLEDLTKKSL